MILVALGSNQGDRENFLARARAAMLREGVNILQASTIYETPALLLPNAPPEWNVPYLNQVVQVETAKEPQALLATLKAIEAELGRIDRGRWSPREIDLDLLAYGAVLMNDTTLALPHPLLHQREFVLKPLAEIAPQWQHPRLKRTTMEMLGAL